MENFLNLPEEKQNTILDAAFAAFGANGYKKASIADIAAAAGISKAPKRRCTSICSSFAGTP